MCFFETAHVKVTHNYVRSRGVSYNVKQVSHCVQLYSVFENICTLGKPNPTLLLHGDCMHATEKIKFCFITVFHALVQNLRRFRNHGEICLTGCELLQQFFFISKEFVCLLKQQCLFAWRVTQNKEQYLMKERQSLLRPIVSLKRKQRQQI